MYRHLVEIRALLLEADRNILSILEEWHEVGEMRMGTSFDPRRHRRRSIRLRGYDYRQAGAYFVTVCTHQKELLFEDPVLQRVVETQWQRIPRHFLHVRLDAWVVMPNHVHGIVLIVDDHRPGRGEASPTTGSCAKAAPEEVIRFVGEVGSGDASPLRPGSLGAIVGSFKSVSARRINRIRRTRGLPVLQRNYYEHVVRDEHALKAIRHYIDDNPARWAWDTYNPAGLGPDDQAAELWRLLQERV